MSAKTGGSAKRMSRLHKFFFVEPQENANADELAEKLISLKNVEEVFVTDGDCGFVVKTRFSMEDEPKDVIQFIKNHVGRSYGAVVSHYEYRKCFSPR